MQTLEDLMTVRERLHHLVDTLPESEELTAARILEALAATADPVRRALQSAPLDEEPESEEERQAVAAARAALARGEVVRDEDLARELGW
jgi:hypothetical protein